MKIFTIGLLLLFFAFHSEAQWTPMNVGTNVNFNDVDFYDANNGVIVGDSGRIYITDNGGIWWTASNFGTVNVTNVKMVSPDTIIVSFTNQNNRPQQSFTHLAGSFWIPMFTDSFCHRGLDTETDLNFKWITIGSSLISTNDHGQYWDTLFEFTCGANNISRIHEIDGVYNAGGLLSGIVTYSASMIRSETQGNSFYRYDPFSFPNSDALTAFDFPTPDTGYIFMNTYVNYAPGTKNSFVKICGFNLTSPSPGDTSFTFTSSVIDTTIPAYINDSEILQSGRGFALGIDGNIYETNNPGSPWTQTYSNGYSLNKISFPDDENGYAVGDHGTILKYTSPVSVKNITVETVLAYPNPASTFIFLNGIKNEKYFLTDINGRIIQTGKTENGKIEIENIPAGFYFINLNIAGKITRSRIIKI